MTEQQGTPEPTRHAKITDNGIGHGSIEVDGHEVHGVTGYTITGEVKRWAKLTLDVSLMRGGLDFEGQAVVHIHAETARSLIALGWTPPASTAAALETDARYVTEREPQDLKTVQRRLNAIGAFDDTDSGSTA